MHDNHLYNLIAQLQQEHKSLWRIKNNYIHDAGECSECKDFWEKMIEDKKDHIEKLTELVRSHL